MAVRRVYGNAKFAGVFAIAVGVLYVRKPGLLRRGIRTKTDIAQRTLFPKGYLKYLFLPKILPGVAKK